MKAEELNEDNLVDDNRPWSAREIWERELKERQKQIDLQYGKILIPTEDYGDITPSVRFLLGTESGLNKLKNYQEQGIIPQIFDNSFWELASHLFWIDGFSQTRPDLYREYNDDSRFHTPTQRDLYNYKILSKQYH